jgi:prepilin-type N-terminal cleavage/methylation domain-containing protein
MFGFYPVVDGFAPMFATVLINLPVFADQKKDINYDQKLHLSHFRPSNQNGFTLIEIMSVLIIMGVMASLVLTKWHIIYDSASLTALKVGVREINTREFLEWSKIKISGNRLHKRPRGL